MDMPKNVIGADIPEERKTILREAAEREADRIVVGASHVDTAFMNMPRGRVIVGAHKPIVALAGPDLARSLMLAQLTHDPASQIPALNAAAKRKHGMSIAERRLARIAAGKLKIVDGKLVGAA